ncbi:MAG: alpha/beta hydrolase-fold protein, partial [Acidimicrobiia bacterium]|nr:alpha/beta hydrolase-fold protein [Acidimicrobiia bacterium]
MAGTVMGPTEQAQHSPFSEERFALTSAETGFRYEITVEVPNRYEPEGDTTYPVVVCLDAQWAFGSVRDAFRILPLGRELPEAVVVGVAHGEHDVRQILQMRAVDFTPTRWEAPVETGVHLPADQVGRAGSFRRFLLDTAVPTVAARYRIGDDRTLVGHSFSALFGLDTLLVEPEAFDRWVLASPSVWWDNQIMFEREAAHAAITDNIEARV